MNPLKESTGAVTNVTLTLCDISSPDARALHDRIAAGELGLIPELHRIATVHVVERANIVPLAGLTQMAKAISGNLASLAEIEPNKTALGTGSAAPNAGDVGLQAEVYRKNVASQSYAANTAYNVAFYTATEVSGTFQEHGVFINGGAGAGTGVLLSRVLLGGIVKTATQSLTAEHTTTFNFIP